MSIFYTRTNKRVINFFTWGLFFTTLFWLLLFLVTGEQYAVIRWVSYITPWLVGAVLVLFVVTLVYKQKFLAFLMFPLLLLIGWQYLQFFIPSKKPPTTGLKTIKVMTYSKMGRNHNIDLVEQTIVKQNPDILFIQEISNSDSSLLIKMLATHYNKGSLFSYIGKQDTLIISKFKIVSEETQGAKAPIIKIDVSGKNIRVWNVHLQKSFFNTDKQYKSVEKLVKQVASEQLPVLVAGDFNATGINYPCVLLKEYLSDAFEESGFGFGFTFPSNARRLGMITSFMRIDHIFHSKHFVSHISYVVQDSGGADHYPVVALLSL